MQFSEFELSILGEIGNVSVGGAATSLSNFIEKIVTISIPKTKIMTFSEVCDHLGKDPVFTKIDYIDGMDGCNIMLLKKEDALEFSRFVVEEKLGTQLYEWNEFAQDALQEIFNIMAGHMSRAMSALFDKQVRINSPSFYESARELQIYAEADVLVSVWFEVKVGDHFKIQMVNIVSLEEAKNMVKLLGGGLEDVD